MSPARKVLRMPPAGDDPMVRLAVELLAMSDDELSAFMAQLPDEDVSLVERAMEARVGNTWRSSPAAMAHHLTKGAIRRWAYAELLSNKFVEAIKGDDPRQIWNMPSQMGKTTWLLTYGVPWALQYDPTLRFMYVTYDDDKAAEEGRKARDFIESHPQLGVQLRPDRRARSMWATPEGGGLYAVGIYGGITGYPADVVLADDLIKGWQVAHSEAEREKAWSIYRSQIRMRIQGHRSAIIVAGTRWHEEDPTGKLLAAATADAEADQFTHVRLPALAEVHDPNSPDPLLRVPDPLGRQPGEVLEPERFDMREVRARAATLGSYLAAGLEQQRPAAEEGNELMRAWFRLEEQLPRKFDQAVTSWDLKMKDREAGDYVVGQCWWRVAGGYWLVDQLRGQWDHGTTANAIALLQVRHPKVRTHLVEAAGSADEVIPQLREAKPDYVVTDEMAGRLGMSVEERKAVQKLRRRGMSGLLPRQPKGDKRVRARAYIVPNAEAGDVHVPAAAVWVPHLLDELAGFPRGAHDDQVDAMSQALKRLAKGPSSVRAPKGKLGDTGGRTAARRTPAPPQRGGRLARPRPRREA